MIIECETEILRPAEEVFPWIADPKKAMIWQKNVREGEIIVSKPEVIGTTFRETLEENGKTLEMYGVITRFVENEKMGFHINSKIHEFDITYSLRGKDNATQILIEAVIRWKFPVNAVSLILGKRIKEKICQQLKSELMELKRLCETENEKAGSGIS